jgi:Anti-sigma-K factor rskA, C-terminal/Putative zinc-finger
MNSHDELRDSVAAYALGALSPDEAAEVRAHLATCAACRAEYEALRPAVTAVAYSAESCADPSTGAAVASPLLKARIMKQVRAEAASKPGGVTRPAYALAAACLALALISTLNNVSLRNQLRSAQTQIAAQSQQDAQQSQTIADLTAKNASHYRFGNGEVLARGPRLYIAMRALPAPPSGKVYQAWTLPKGSKKMAPSLTFRPAAGGVTVIRLPESAVGVAAVAVSIEPEGGSKQPTSTPIAVTQL